jgi:hypothetical protein
MLRISIFFGNLLPVNNECNALTRRQMEIKKETGNEQIVVEERWLQIYLFYVINDVMV